MSNLNELEGLYLKDLEALVKRGTNFISKITSKEFLQIEESDPVFSAIQNLSGKMDLLSQIRIIILTNKFIVLRYIAAMSFYKLCRQHNR